MGLCMFFFNDTATTEIYTYLHTLPLHDALPICQRAVAVGRRLSVHPDAGGGRGGCGLGAVLIAPIERTAQTGSTNADLLARLAGGEAVGEGHWLIADRQTSGRGRLDRKSTRLNSSH